MDEGEGQPERLWDLARLRLGDSTPTLHTRLTLREKPLPTQRLGLERGEAGEGWMVEGGRGGRGGHVVVVVDAEVLEEVEEKLVEHVGFWSISFSGTDFWVHQFLHT